LKEISKRLTAKHGVAGTIGLPKIINELFQHQLPKIRSNLDPRKKRALLDFLKCIPRIMEYATKKDPIQRPFVKAQMTDEETRVFPNFDSLVGTCKHWVSSKKGIDIKKELKIRCKMQVQLVARIQVEEGGVTYEDMIRHAIPRGALHFINTYCNLTQHITYSNIIVHCLFKSICCRYNLSR